MKIKKDEITIDGIVYCFIKSKDEKGKKRCEHFIKYKTDTPIYWEARSEKTTSQYFYYNGKRHREDGPAVIWTTTTKWENGQTWYINGIMLTKEEEQNQIRKINLKKCLL